MLLGAAVNGYSQVPVSRQTASTVLNGSVLTDDRLPIDSCQLHLMRMDSVLIASAWSDSSGQFFMPNIPIGSFLLRSVHPQYMTSSQVVEVTTTDSLSAKTLILQPRVIKLTEVSIKEKRPAFELAGDRVILNIDGSPVFAGGYAIDALSMAPRISVDPISKTIAVDGKTGLILYQNGRQLYLPADQITGYLRSLSVNSISRIEVLTNPPAQYDAGSSAVILLFTRRAFREGFTGDVSATVGAGRYLKANGTLALSLLTPKVEGSFLYTPGYNPTYYSWKANQIIMGTPAQTTGFSQSDQFNEVDYSSHVLRTSWDWNLSKTFTAGIVAQGSLIRSTNNPSSDLSYQLAQNDSPVVRLDALTRNRERIDNGTINIHARKQSADGHQSLSVDFDLGSYANQSRVRSDFTQQKPIAASTESVQIYYPGSVQILTGKADYVNAHLGKASLEAGLKYSAIQMTNEPSTERISPGFVAIQPLLSRPYQYMENTASAYASMSRNWDQWFLTAGLRVEHTDYRGVSMPTQPIERTYTNLFPTFSLRHTTETKYQYSVSASRRIVRPAFDLLNPAFLFYDPLTLYSGNPLLVPQLTNSLQATVTLPEGLAVNVVYNRSRNRIAEVIYRLDSTSATTLDRSINFDREDRVALTVSLPWKPLPAWQLQASVTGANTQFYSTFRDAPMQLGQTTAIVRVNNTITLGKWTANINVIYRNRAIIGYMYYDPLWYVDLGVQRHLGKQTSVKLAASDIFHTLLITNHGEYLNTNIIFRHRYESQRVLLTLTHKFGDGKKRVNERPLGSDTEQGRLGGQSRN